MTHSDGLARSVIEALKALPGTLHELSKRTGVSYALLWRIRDGSRGVTPAVAAKLVAALERWGSESRAAGDRCYAAARVIRRAVRQPRGQHGKA